MDFGISSYTYTWATGVPGSLPAKPMSPFDLIDRAESSGVTTVQIADNMPLETFTEIQIDEIRDYASERGITIEMGGRGLTIRHTLECLRTAERLGSPILRMVVDSAGFEPDIQSIISIIRDLTPEFQSSKIKLAIENHDRLKAREFEKIVLSTGSDMVGICLDSVNSMGAGEGFETVAGILLPYTINLHIKDFTIRRVSHKMGLIIEGTPAGKGMLNIKELIYELDAMKRCRSAILELWTPPEASAEETIKKEEKWAEESIKYLKTIAGERTSFQ